MERKGKGIQRWQGGKGGLYRVHLSCKQEIHEKPQAFPSSNSHPVSQSTKCNTDLLQSRFQTGVRNVGRVVEQTLMVLGRVVKVVATPQTECHLLSSCLRI